MRSLLLILVPVLLFAVAFPTRSDAVWTPVMNVHQAVIQQVGRFAVIVYNLGHRANLVYVDVLRGETDKAVGGGTNYRLVVTAANPGGSNAQYECLVWGVPGSRSYMWKVHGFRKI